ncbi:MAG: sensor histidine kinase [Dehalococcoidia bacterium]
MTSPAAPQRFWHATRAAWVLALGGLALIALYGAGQALRPSDAYIRFQSDWIYHIAPVGALLLSMIPIFRSTGRERLGWLSLAFVLLTWDLGDWTYTYYDARYATEPPFPGVTDVLYYAGYAGFVAGIVLLVYPRGRVTDRRWIIDACIVMVVAGALSWVYLIAPIIESGGYTPGDAAISLGYPLLDLVVLAILVFAVYASGWRLQRRAVLLIGSAVLLVVADGIYTYLFSTVGYETVGNPLDPLWLGSYLLMGVCFVLPREQPFEAAPQRQSFLGILLPYTVATPMFGLAIANETLGARSDVLAMAALVTAVLIGARQFLTLNENLTLFRQFERESDARRALLDRVVTAQEDERHRVALDLHDGPVQALSLLATRLGSAKKFLQRGEAERATGILNDVEASVTKEVQGIRELMMDLRPPALEERGLDSALRDLATETARQSGLRIEVLGTPGLRVDRAMESIIYRLGQEALTNVRKHANASAVQLALGVESDVLVLRVSDDGRGFEVKATSALAAAGQYGLLGMIERAELLGGGCEWTPRQPSGTDFVARVPMQTQRKVAA